MENEPSGPPRAALARDLASLGPFTSAELHGPDVAPTPPWETLGGLTDDPERLGARVAAVQRALAARSGEPAAVTPRVAASVAHLGLVARLVAPLLSMRALGHPVDPAPAGVWWQDRLGGPVPLSLPLGPAARTTGLPVAVVDLTQAVLAAFSVSPTVLWGNVGSAVNGSATAVASARPDLRPAVTTAADAMLADPRIDGGVHRTGPGFRRRSCCLIHRVAGNRDAVCGDCVLVR